MDLDYGESKEFECEVQTAETPQLEIKSPQDPQTEPAVYCPYCGLSCLLLTNFEAHLKTCKRFSQMKLNLDQPRLESILFRAWSERSSADICESEGPLISYGSCHSHSLGDCDGLVEKTVPKTPNSAFLEQKLCPFCEETFDEGNAFSSHLLKCKQRKLLRKQRRAKKKEESPQEDPRRKVPAAGRKMPWE